jgi:hypothetical protein
MSKKYVDIDIGHLLVDQDNFRIGEHDGQASAIKAMIAEQGEGLSNLAQHIAENGLSPNKSVTVIPHPKDKGFYLVMDGNRRTTAIKLVVNPSLADKTALAKKFSELHKAHGKTIEQKIRCVQLNEEEAKLWRRVDHYKGQKGVAQEMWSSVANERADRADGKSSAVLDALEFVLAGNAITDGVRNIAKSTDFELSTFGRIIDAVPARTKLGIDVKKKTIVSKKPKDWLLRVLSEIVTVVATKQYEGKKFAVKDVYSTKDAGDFADKIVKRVGSTSKRAVQWTVNEDNAVALPKATAPAKKTVAKPKPIKAQESWNRDTVIPSSYPIEKFNSAKLNNIYCELKSVNPSDHPNACALLFRTLLELSLQLYCDKQQIAVTNDPNKWTVKGAATKCVEFLKKSKGWDKTKAAKIISLLQKQPLCITAELNSYVHHNDFHPEWRSLNVAWDNLQPFFDEILVELK